MEPSLRDIAQQQGLLLGAAVDEQSFHDAAYRNFLATHFNCLYPSSAFKWPCIQPTQGKFNFDLADRIVDFALEQGCKTRLNCLLWHKALPKWVTRLRVSGASAWELVEEHVTKIFDHFRGRIHYCDVVNEAIDDNGVFRRVGFAPLLGEGWIPRAFRLAHSVAPDTELFYCEYRLKADGKWQTVRQMVKHLLEQQAPIHGLAVQLHSRMVPALGRDQVIRHLQRLTPLQLKIHLPECGVWIPPGYPLEGRQARIYGGFAQAGQAMGVEMLGFWWPTDWRADQRIWLDFQGNPARPGLFDERMQPKPAYHSVKTALSAPALKGSTPSAFQS